MRVGAGRYLGKLAAGTPTGTDMADPRMEHVNDIRDRVERQQYEVDASAVARAILARLLQSAERPSDPQSRN
jgi:hypothetical protein